MSHATAARVAGYGRPMTTSKPDHARVMARADVLFNRIERELQILDEFRRTQAYIATINHRRRKGDK